LSAFFTAKYSAIRQLFSEDVMKCAEAPSDGFFKGFWNLKVFIITFGVVNDIIPPGSIQSNLFIVSPALLI